MRPYSNQSRTWIDDRMFSWYTYGGPAAGRRSFPMEDEEWNSAGRANQNGEQRPRKVTFIDPPFIAPEKKSSIQESFDNIKKMFGKLTGWISDSISDLSIRQSLQGVSLRQLFVKVAERFSSEKHHVEVLTPTTRTHSRVLRPDELPPKYSNPQLDFFVTGGSHGHPKRQRLSFVSNPMSGPNHISIMNHSRNSGGNQPEVLDQQTLTEWFIKCINSHEKNSDSKMSSQSKSSLERQVSQMLSGCFDKFGNFSNSPDDADYTVKDANYQQDEDDDDNNNNNNSMSSSCDNKKPDKIEEKSVSESGRPENKGHSHQSSSLSDPGRGADERSNMNQHDSCPLMCSLKEAEGKDVSELVKMFNSYAFLENNYDKNTLSEKYSNVNVKNTIKQLDLILFREREKIRGSRLYLAGSDNSRKLDESSTNEGSTGKLLKSIEDNAVKGENVKFSQRPNTFRDMMRRAFRMKTNPSSVRNRSSTLPPNRAVKFSVPSQQQQLQQQQQNCVSSLTSLMSGKKTNNNSRNILDTLNKQQQQQVGNSKSPSNPDNVKENKSKDKLDPFKQHNRKNKTRSKSVLPQSISVPPWRRSRSKGCKNTEDSFNFLFQKLFADQPSFPSKEDGEFGRNSDMETHCSESLWNRIYAWELKERMEDLSKNNKRSSKAVDSPGCSRRRFVTRSVGEDNKNSSSSAMTVYHSKSTDTELSLHPNNEVSVGGKYPTIHRSTWHLHAKDQNLKLRNTLGTTAFKVTKGQRKQNCDMKSVSKSRLSINRKKLMFEGLKDQTPMALIKSLNKNDKKSEDSYSISSAHSLARRITVQTDKGCPVSEELNKVPKPIPRKLRKKELSLATQQRMKRLVSHVNSGIMTAFDEVIKQLKDTKIDGRECESNKNAKEQSAKKVYNAKVHNNLRRSSQDSTLASSVPSRKVGLSDTRGVQSLIKVFEGLPQKSHELNEDSVTLSRMKEEVE